MKNSTEFHKRQQIENANIPKLFKPYGINNNDNSYILSNLFNQLKGLESNKKLKINEIRNSKFIPKKIIKTLLLIMNKNTNLTFNNFNSVNFIYQTFNKGLNIMQYRTKSQNREKSLESCFRQRKLNTNFRDNFSAHSSLIRSNKNSNNKYKEKFNFNQSYNNNRSNNISTNKNLLNLNSPVKNMEPINRGYLINGTKLRKKVNLKANYLLKYKGNNSYKIQNEKSNINPKMKLRQQLLVNKTDVSNETINFALLPLNKILTKFTKLGKNKKFINNRTIKSSTLRKKTIDTINKENYLYIKSFTDKYEKEKQNFNNVLFDECMENRKKKFQLESFIKRFGNNHFVEKLYKAKAYSLKKMH